MSPSAVPPDPATPFGFCKRSFQGRFFMASGLGLWLGFEVAGCWFERKGKPIKNPEPSG
jgi:hypothetical protein